MARFTSAEADACQALIALALAEDLGQTGDRTSSALIAESAVGRGVFVARKPGVVAGVPAVEQVLATVDSRLNLEVHLPDGQPVERGTALATVRGPLLSILIAERTALNFLQRLSGIASLTRRYVEAVRGLPVQVLDTRKTTPGWRLLEKYAVRAGGGTNHRLGLYDGILIKDNHLAGLGEPATAVRRAIELARGFPGNEGLPVEVEVDSLEQLDQALSRRVEIVLLDNMTMEQLRAAVLRRNEVSPATRLEASGGVTLETIRTVAETGVDRISVGALTHSATALDIALDYQSG
jgi:nicotinate-nucleotide pyrophosphorylase (carboxylating)